jgi:hypothetical protein
MPILTKYKDRLPSHLSYPVGLQTLVNALADIPQAENLSVCFFAYEDSASKVRKKQNEGGFYSILAAEFHHYRLGISECRDMESLYEPTWYVNIYGVTRQKRNIARNLLIEKGIPKIAVWLKSPRSETWLVGKKRITVAFSDEKESILVTETSTQ